MLKLKSYSLFGDDDEYKDITFETPSENQIEINVYKSSGRISISCEDVTIEELEEAIKIFRGGVVNL